MTEMVKKASSRLLSLDVLRGITVAGMILVNNPGLSSVYAPLRHAAWNGLTPTDLVFPFFMFIMGISMYFSLRKFDFRPSRHLWLKIVRRTVLIYIIGVTGLPRPMRRCRYGIEYAGRPTTSTI